ncbi:MAG: magnetochrome domain-containing protein [Desulfobulbaceae bacterium]|nr:magnetochrome domain-containing protein [Desulfobulbaceae bacterium]HIJ79399.1 magnetochrome domain-containing protein [Deltaproteobacteria bacterium]
MKKLDSEFCMKHFKPSIVGLVALIVIVLAWSMYTSDFGRLQRHHGLSLAAATAAPPAGNILVKDPMRHPYWGNCNKCHITVDVPAQPVSQVFAGPVIGVNDKMTHDYWGNCNLCHRVTGGFQATSPTRAAAAPGGIPPIKANAPAPHADWGKCNNCHQIIGATPAAFGLAAAPGGIPPIKANAPSPHADWGKCNNCHQIIGATPAAFAPAAAAGGIPPISANATPPHGNRGNCTNCHQIINNGTTPVAFGLVTDTTLGLRLQNVDARLRQQTGLLLEGVLVTQVAPGSAAAKAGIEQGDEIIRVNRSKVDTVNEFNASLAQVKKGDTVKFNISRNKKGRNFFIRIPDTLALPAAFAAQVPPAPLQPPLPAPILTGPATPPNHGLVAIAAAGPGQGDPVASEFALNPYFIVFDPDTGEVNSIVNPNYTDRTGNAAQASQMMIDLGVANVVAGNFSNQSFAHLRSLGVHVYPGVHGTVRQAIHLYEAGTLQAAVFNNDPAAGEFIARQRTAPQRRGVVF